MPVRAFMMEKLAKRLRAEAQKNPAQYGNMDEATMQQTLEATLEKHYTREVSVQWCVIGGFLIGVRRVEGNGAVL